MVKVFRLLIKVFVLWLLVLGILMSKKLILVNIYAISTWIRWANIESACIRCICARNAFAGDIKLRIMAKSRIILVGLRINNYCLLLFMGLIFASTKEVNC